MLSCRSSEELPQFSSLLEKLSKVMREDGVSLSRERELEGSAAVLAREREAFLKAKFIEVRPRLQIVQCNSMHPVSIYNFRIGTVIK